MKIIYTILIVVVILITGIYFFINRQSILTSFVYSNPSESNINFWRDFTFNSYLKEKFIATNDSYLEQLDIHNLNENLTLLYKTVSKQTYLDYPQVKENNNNTLPKDLKLAVPGKAGVYNVDSNYLNIRSKDNYNKKLINKDILLIQSRVDQQTITGTKLEIDFVSNLKEIFKNDKYKVTSFDKSNSIILFEKDDEFKTIGEVEIFINRCFETIKLDLQYKLSDNIFRIKDSTKIESYKCKVIQDYIIVDCTDCTLDVVDKKHRLSKNYAPQKVTSISEIPGGQQVDARIKEDLLNMYNDALKAGHKMNLTSGYRSYATQEQTFEYWVNYEMSFGYGRAIAEQRANTYSAKPGFSEHQLGTTVDINSLDCQAFTTYCQANDSLWKWLDANAYKYGFAISYQPQFVQQTGYVSEPWHYRWIGKDLSADYEKVEEQMPLASFLESLAK